MKSNLRLIEECESQTKELRPSPSSPADVEFSVSLLGRWQMHIRHILLLVLATLGAIGAIGCWVLTQADAAITPQEAPTLILILLGCITIFLGASFISAAVITKGQSGVAKIRRALFLIGVCGVIAVLFFALISLGRIFLFGPFPTVLLAVFVLMALSSRMQERVK